MEPGAADRHADPVTEDGDDGVAVDVFDRGEFPDNATVHKLSDLDAIARAAFLQESIVSFLSHAKRLGCET